jgi:hypothetical protein
LPGRETTLLVFGWEAEVTDGVCGMSSSPAAEMPYAEETSPPLFAEAGTTMAATANGTATTPAIAPYLTCLRMKYLS